MKKVFLATLAIAVAALLTTLVTPAMANDLSREEIIEITVGFQGFVYEGETEFVYEGAKSNRIDIRTVGIDAVIDQGGNRYRVITRSVNGVSFKKSGGRGISVGEWTSLYEVFVSYAEGGRIFVEEIRYLKTLDGKALAQPDIDEYRDITIEEDFMFSAAKAQWNRNKN